MMEMKKEFLGIFYSCFKLGCFLEELEVDKLEDATYHFKEFGKRATKGKHVTIMSCGHSS